MSLSFLYPLAWLGAVALAVPVWLHLERRRAANVILFSALQFLEDQPTAQREPLWPRDWPLLLLRLLALLLLVAAFAWPYLPNAGTPAVISRSTVYILDNTLSHQADDQFRAARQNIAAAVADAGRGQQAAVVELTALPRVVVAFADAPEEARDKVRRLRPSHQRGSYRAALLLATELLQNSLGEERRIVVLGDHQENQWHELREAGLLLGDIALEVEPAPQAARGNLAVARPQVRRVFAGDPPLVEATCQLLHQGAATEATLELIANGRSVQRETVRLANQPEVLTLGFRWESSAQEWLRGEFVVRGEDDSLLSDNRVAFSLPPVRAGHVALLAGSKYLHTALGPDVMRGRWHTQVLASEAIARPEPRPDVVCLESSLLTQPGAKDLLLDQLNAGGGAVLVLDRITPAVEAVLKQLDITVRGRVEDPRDARLRYIFFEHPVFQPFRSAEFGDLTQLRVNTHHQVEMPGALPLVFSAEGDPLLLQGGAHGRLLVLTFPLERSATNWPLHTSFVPFLDRCLEHARPPVHQQGAFAPGEACVWSVPADRAVRSVALRQQGKMLKQVPVENGQARFVLPDEPGWYELTYNGASDVEAVLDVNPSPDESQLKYTDPGELVAAWQEGQPRRRIAAAAAEPVEATRAGILQQRLWWWLLVAGALALLVETIWLAARRESSHGVQAAH